MFYGQNSSEAVDCTVGKLKLWDSYDSSMIVVGELYLYSFGLGLLMSWARLSDVAGTYVKARLYVTHNQRHIVCCTLSPGWSLSGMNSIKCYLL